MGAHGHAARRRRQGLRETLLRICDLVHQEQADALLCGGDLFEHERATPDTAAFLRAAFARLDPLPVYLAPGNHDWLGPRSLYRQVAWSPNVRLFTSDRLEPLALADGLTLWGAAHLAPANTDGFLEGFRVDRGGVHLALFHGSERGWLAEQGEGKAPHAPFSAEQLERAGLHHALLGHYHRPRDAERYTYPGNPDPLVFGEDGSARARLPTAARSGNPDPLALAEDGPRGAVVLTVLADGSMRRERRRVASVETHDLTLDVSGCASQSEVRERLVGLVQPLRGLARLTLAGELAPEVDLHPSDLLDVAPWLEGLVVRMDRVRLAYDLATIQREPTVRGQFVREVLAAELSEDERRRVVATGLRALDGRDDLEVW